MHWLVHILGIDSVSDWPYAFWSGSGSKLLSVAPWLLVWHRFNCHQPGCWRIGRYHIDGTSYLVCRRCHPDDQPGP